RVSKGTAPILRRYIRTLSVLLARSTTAFSFTFFCTLGLLGPLVLKRSSTASSKENSTPGLLGPPACLLAWASPRSGFCFFCCIDVLALLTGLYSLGPVLTLVHPSRVSRYRPK